MRSSVYLGVLASILLASCGAEDKSPTALAGQATTATSTDNRGDKGDKGEKGEKGDKGETGSGKDGSTGTKGTNGTNGVAGTNGTNGTSSQVFDVFDSSGIKFGELYGVNWSSNLYYVVDSANDRFEVDQTNGTFPYAYIVYSGLNCTGTKRLLLQNGKFANVYVDGTDSTLVRMAGQNLGAFNYQSRVPAGTSCQNASGSTTNSYASQTYAPSFTYPLGRLDIEN